MMRGSYSDRIIVGLDIGTTKICTVIGEIVKSELAFRGAHLSPAAGMRKGIIVNMEEMIASIKNALQAAESSFGVEINSVYVSISGGHVKGLRTIGAVGIAGREVTHSDIDLALDSASTVYVPIDREILHVMPAGFAIDGMNGIHDPIGMTGERLEAKGCAITGAAAPVQNLLRCCEKVGVEVAEVVFSPVASAGIILTDDERTQGVALVDIGAGTTDILIFQDGWPTHATVLPIGGNHFTNDIAIGLRIPVNEAEKIKISVGGLSYYSVGASEQIEIVRDGKKRTISQKLLVEILQARTEELIDLIRGEFRACSGYDAALTSVVLTGGGALLKGFDKMAEAVWGLPVRIGNPTNPFGSQELADNPVCSTGVGLVVYGFEVSPERSATKVFNPGIMEKVKDWAKDIFKIKKGGMEYVRN